MECGFLVYGPSAAPQDDEHVVMKCGFVGGCAAHKTYPYHKTPCHPERLREGPYTPKPTPTLTRLVILNACVKNQTLA